ncbi:phage tail protein [Streptomyces sp. H27-C3]|uniref:phage tail protein n=1 Tax=Streptomyces sp. H27-C3 TaxID=3046305 RepID=UPI0024B90B44|nr:phage tail protein [Streptomyces sp. H27-C3]MDJ0466193.1 phage tail protein [Streptomyces sp. H27-C3]
MAEQQSNQFIVYTFGIQIDGVQLEQLKTVSGISQEREVVTTHHTTDKGVEFISKQPGKRTVPSVTITRGMDKSKALNDWIKISHDEGDIDKARKNVTIEMKDNKGTTVRRVTLERAWVSKWVSGDLTAGESNAIDETVTIECESLKVEHA